MNAKTLIDFSQAAIRYEESELNENDLQGSCCCIEVLFNIKRNFFSLLFYDWLLITSSFCFSTSDYF